MISIILTALFVLSMLAIGIWGMYRTKTLEDFFLGGRSVGPWVSAFAYGTSYFSAVLFIGFAGSLGWSFGLNSLWIALGNALIGSLLAWLVLGKRTRRMTQKLDVMTMPEYFAERYQAPAIKPFAALIIFIFLIPYSASVYKGLGHLFQVNFGISYDAALLIMTLIAGIYLVLGGYFAITLTDFVQGIIMIFGSLTMVAILVGQGGGMTEILHTISVEYPKHVAVQPPTYLLVSLVIMTSLGTWGLPQMIHKFYAIKNERVILNAAIATTVFALIVVLSAYFVGSMSHVYFDELPQGAQPFDRLVPDMLKANLPEALMALILLLILSASMSTLSSLVLVSSSAVTIDFYKGHINPHASTRCSVGLMRILSGIFILASFFIARYKIGIIVTLMSLSWGAVAGAFLAPYLYGLYDKKTTKAGAASGMITGLFLAIVLFFWLGPKLAPVSATIAMVVPFIIVPVVSRFTPPPDPQLIEKAFSPIIDD